MATSLSWHPALRYREGIVYMVENLLDGKRYIGQTIHTFVRRYPGGRWWEHTNNPYLKRAAAKHGHDAFRVTILHYGKTPEELNRLEEEYARVLNCYSPHGYNLVQCGQSKRHHPDSVLKRCRTLTLNDPSGKDVTVTNIKGFCRDNRLDERSLSRVIRGDHASHKGWSLAGVTQKHHRNNHSYVVYERDGARHDITGLTSWCRERGLVYHAMRSMVQGKTFESQGYALNPEAFAKQRQRHVVTLTKGDREVVVRNVKQECTSLGLGSARLYMLIAGKLTTYKGWSVKALTSEPI